MLEGMVEALDDERRRLLEEEELRYVLRSYKWRTGLGLDGIHPRHLGLCSAGLLLLWGELSTFCEERGEWQRNKWKVVVGH